MKEIASPSWYRWFQAIATAGGAVTAACGFSLAYFSSVPRATEVGAGGLLVLMHGLIALLLLRIEDRRNRKNSGS